MAKFDEINKNDLIKAIKDNISYYSTIKSLDVSLNSYNIKKLHQFIEHNNIDVSHFKKILTKDEYEQNPKVCKNCGKILP